MLTKKMLKMLIGLNEKCCVQITLCEHGIIDMECAENEIKRLFDEFETMMTSMYHFKLLTDNDTWFGKQYEMDGVKTNMYVVLRCFRDFIISGEIPADEMAKMFRDIAIM